MKKLAYDWVYLKDIPTYKYDPDPKLLDRLLDFNKESFNKLEKDIPKMYRRLLLRLFKKELYSIISGLNKF